jgi:hypothetical protein
MARPGVELGMRRHLPLRLLAAGHAIGIVVVLAAACSDDSSSVATDDGSSPTTTTIPPASARGRYEAVGTILEDAGHGPQLCLGIVLDSYPPQCGGPDVVGFDWEQVPWRESANGTTWAGAHVVGTWDGDRLTLTESPGEPSDDGAAAVPELDFTAPCDPPPGGWAVRDPGKLSMADQQAAYDYANAQPGLAASWVDQSVNPAYPGSGPMSSDVAMKLNDPSLMVLVFAFTDDLDRHRGELERRWGGMLCVTQRPVPRAELVALQQRISGDRELRMLSSSLDEINGRIDLTVVVADDATLALVRERYGDLVDVTGALKPVD